MYQKLSRLILEDLQKTKSGKLKILDVGAGAGRLVDEVHKAIESSDKLTTTANKRLHFTGLEANENATWDEKYDKYVKGVDGYAYPFLLKQKNGSFNYVIFASSFECLAPSTGESCINVSLKVAKKGLYILFSKKGYLDKANLFNRKNLNWSQSQFVDFGGYVIDQDDEYILIYFDKKKYKKAAKFLPKTLIDQFEGCRFNVDGRLNEHVK